MGNGKNDTTEKRFNEQKTKGNLNLDKWQK